MGQKENISNIAELIKNHASIEEYKEFVNAAVPGKNFNVCLILKANELSKYVQTLQILVKYVDNIEQDKQSEALFGNKNFFNADADKVNIGTILLNIDNNIDSIDIEKNINARILDIDEYFNKIQNERKDILFVKNHSVPQYCDQLKSGVIDFSKLNLSNESVLKEIKNTVVALSFYINPLEMSGRLEKAKEDISMIINAQPIYGYVLRQMNKQRNIDITSSKYAKHYINIIAFCKECDKYDEVKSFLAETILKPASEAYEREFENISSYLAFITSYALIFIKECSIHAQAVYDKVDLKVKAVNAKIKTVFKDNTLLKKEGKKKIVRLGDFEYNITGLELVFYENYKIVSDFMNTSVKQHIEYFNDKFGTKISTNRIKN